MFRSVPIDAADQPRWNIRLLASALLCNCTIFKLGQKNWKAIKLRRNTGFVQKAGTREYINQSINQSINQFIWRIHTRQYDMNEQNNAKGHQGSKFSKSKKISCHIFLTDGVYRGIRQGPRYYSLEKVFKILNTSDKTYAKIMLRPYRLFWP